MVKRIALNLLAILIVVSCGIIGWWITLPSASNTPDHESPRHRHGKADEGIQFSPVGQIFGYLCACLYLSSRLPQMLLNYRRKSTEGVSMLFFMFACIGNLTYVLSILFYDPRRHCMGNRGRCWDGEATKLYWRYIAVNASWLAGSAGTLLLDAVIFAQFWLYRGRSAVSSGEQDASRAPEYEDTRPLLERGDS